MVMNKTERARMKALETELALRWPIFPEPEPMTEAEITAGLVPLKPHDTSGYQTRKAALCWCMNAYSRVVEPAWSTGMIHGRGNHTGDGGSQGRGQMYRTKLEASQALRWEMCRIMAAQLRTIDRFIEEAA